MSRIIAEVDLASRELADGASRILEWVQGLPSLADRLVAAALDRDWREVDRLSEQLAALNEEPYERVSRLASELRRDLAKADNERGVRRRLVRLIFECGRIDPRNLEPRQRGPAAGALEASPLNGKSRRRIAPGASGAY